MSAAGSTCSARSLRWGFHQLGKFAGLLRLARLSRLARITRLLQGENKKALVKDILEHRSQYAGFLTILLTILVLTVASVLVLQFESQSPDAKITRVGTRSGIRS